MGVTQAGDILASLAAPDGASPPTGPEPLSLLHSLLRAEINCTTILLFVSSYSFSGAAA
jgi:hypothetical protein